jgi:hypothetical protein
MLLAMLSISKCVRLMFNFFEHFTLFYISLLYYGHTPVKSVWHTSSGTGTIV